MTAPTAREVAIYEAARRHRSITAASRELGVTVGAISSGVIRYRQKTGEPYPFEPVFGRKVGTPNIRTAVMSALPGRLEELERLALELAGRIDTLERTNAGLEVSIRSFLERQPIVLAPARDALQPTHRRIADGGIGGRREVREAR